jgi:hypothetical protein
MRGYGRMISGSVWRRIGLALPIIRRLLALAAAGADCRGVIILGKAGFIIGRGVLAVDTGIINIVPIRNRLVLGAAHNCASQCNDI